MSRYDQSEKDIMGSWSPSPQQERFQEFLKAGPRMDTEYDKLTDYVHNVVPKYVITSEEPIHTGTDTVTDGNKEVGRTASFKESEGAMAAGGSNATASDSGAFNARYSSKKFDDFVSTPLGSPRDFSEREHQEAPDHPGAPDVHAD